ncbi:Possibl zinc metallo-peptidase [Corynebacterium atrinae]|uniref:metallopeptidase family protein n=1 Tax=Corynebacterium atrinae TaxID=1336740 RepID=UPI0025B44CAE|nr:metallopeptidase family protein [Corynebacterium atrinae]WJY64554.1 Possibl zinc metallo-peptidase [Corynebacterium atrinae]
MIEVSDASFEEMVNDAIDLIPEEFARHLGNVVFLVQEFNEANPEILGLYEGVMLTERTFDHTGFLPDTISIYKGALQRFCDTEEQLAAEIKVTVFHEVGHYFGLEEHELHELGWG